MRLSFEEGLAEQVALLIDDWVIRVGRALARLALSQRPDKSPDPPFEVHARDLGALRPGLSLDNVGALIEAAEGPAHR